MESSHLTDCFLFFVSAFLWEKSLQKKPFAFLLKKKMLAKETVCGAQAVYVRKTKCAYRTVCGALL